MVYFTLVFRSAQNCDLMISIYGLFLPYKDHLKSLAVLQW